MCMVKTILFTSRPTETRAALLENGKVAELVVERPDDIRIAGNIYRGRIDSVIPGLQAAFIDIGLDKCAFLHASDVDPRLLLEKDSQLVEQYMNRLRGKRRKVPQVPIEKVMKVGQEILVQIIKEPIGSKGPKVTTNLSIAGRFLVLVPDSDFIGVSKKSMDLKKRRRLKQLLSSLKPSGIGFIVRTIGLEVSEEEFVKEIHSLIKAWQDLRTKALSSENDRLVHKEIGIATRVMRDLLDNEVQEVWVDEEKEYEEIKAYLQTVSSHLLGRLFLYKEKIPLFDKFDIEKDLERSLKRKVWLKSGGYLTFDHGEALLAIDVNTGRNIGKREFEETLLHTNLEAAVEICRQLRLRDIGGLIVVDFIDMRIMENRKKVEREMRYRLHRDSSSIVCTGLSKFCLLEITRKRTRPELQQMYTDICPTCNGLGWVFSPATVTARIDRWLKRADLRPEDRKLTLAVHPSVAKYLQEKNRDVMQKLEEVHHVKLHLMEDENFDQDEYEFYPQGKHRDYGDVGA
ncbi:MAG: Rne/Rng family ribonuclease [Chitinivibrionales bacterium]|nr:Rne/Rng family ribonuclease [Chitinivibrionales bacterium]